MVQRDLPKYHEWKKLLRQAKTGVPVEKTAFIKGDQERASYLVISLAVLGSAWQCLAVFGSVWQCLPVIPAMVPVLSVAPGTAASGEGLWGRRRGRGPPLLMRAVRRPPTRRRGWTPV